MPALKLPRRATVSKWATNGAWFFVAFSLASVGWALLQQWADPSATTRLYGEAAHSAWGLTYGGVLGLLLALVQAVAVGGAALLSTLPRARPRRIGHRVLMAWAGLWWLNLLWLASVDMGVGSFARAAFMTALFAATVYRATRRPVKVVKVEDLPAAPAARETDPEESPVIVANEGMTGPDEPAAASLRERASAVAQRAADGTRNRLRESLTKGRPALRSVLASAQRGFTRLQSRLRNGWKTTSV